MKAKTPQPIQHLYVPDNAPRFRPRTRGNYTQEMNHVYAEAHGLGLLMDIFVPTHASNGLGIVDVVSGAWHSDRIRLNEHIGLGLIDCLCERGYTVFAVSPGSVKKFTGFEMASHVKAAIRHIRAHAEAFGVETEPLGLVGASAGGHLAALAAMTAEAAHPTRRNPYKRVATTVQALGLFFPPTDLLDFGGKPFNFNRSVGLPVDTLLAHDGLEGHSEKTIQKYIKKLSPALLPTPEHMPPVYLLHATEDEVVPFQQSEAFAAHLEQAKAPVTLASHSGKGHPWPSIREDIEVLVDWLDQKLVER